MRKFINIIILLLFQFLSFEARANNSYPFANDANLNYYSQASTDSNRLFVSSNLIDFGLVHVNFLDSVIFEITCIGEIDSILIQTRSPFFIKYHSFFKILPDSILKLNLYFRPLEMGQYQDTLDLQFTYIDSLSNIIYGRTSVLLKGLGADARINFFSNSYSFGDVHLGDKKEFSVPIENMGNIPLLIKSVTTQNISFSIITPIVDQIKSSSIDFLKFQFGPAEINNDSAMVDIYYTDPLLQNIKPDTTIKNSKLILYGVGKKSILQILDFENLTEISTLNFGESYIDSVRHRKAVLKNSGNLDLIMESPRFQSNEFKLVARQGQVYPILILKNDTIHINIEFRPSRDDISSDTALFSYYDIFSSKIYRDSAILNLNGKGVARGPIIYDVSNSIPILYQDCSVQAKISSLYSELVEDSIRLWIRKGGELDFNSWSFIEKRSPNTFIFKIPGEWISLRGIEYFIEAYDVALNRSHFPNRSKFDYVSPPVDLPEEGIIGVDYNEQTVELHRGNAQKDYRLISIPVQIDETRSSVFDILSTSLKFQKYDEYDWRCVDYHYFDDENQSRFIYLDDPEFSDFGPGKSFFLIIKKSWQHNQIVCPHGYTIRTDTIYNQIPLSRGWNLIANPFDFPIPFKNLYLSVSGSVNSIRKYIDKWDLETESIQPWTGYAIYTEQAETLYINPDLRQSFLQKKIKKEQQELNYQWYISIEASCQDARDVDNIAAISLSGSIAHDCYDQPEPPPIGEYVMLAFPHPEWAKACDFFAVDVQPPNFEGNFWDFSVYTNIPNSDVKLNFKNLDSVPDNFQIVLIDENLKIVQGLRSKREFIYNSTTAKQEYRFRLLVGNQEFVESHNFNINFLPEKFDVSINFPNPFNNATYIRYDLPEQDEISIQVYNMLGELIKTIKKNEIHSSGRYFIIWDGLNEKGNTVGSGIYFCKFISQHCSKTIKMLLIR